MVPTDQTIVVGWRKNEAWEEKNESHRNSLQALSPSPSLVSASTFVPSFLMEQSGPFLFPLVFQKVGFATYCCINWCLRTNGKVEKVTTSLSLTSCNYLCVVQQTTTLATAELHFLTLGDNKSGQKCTEAHIYDQKHMQQQKLAY